jgi:hypothetical protein
MASNPPLKPLHSEASLIHTKLDYFGRLSSDDLILSFAAARRSKRDLMQPSSTVITA